MTPLKKVVRLRSILAFFSPAFPAAEAHLTYSGRDFGAFSGTTNASIAVTNQAVTGNWGWADAADGIPGDNRLAVEAASVQGPEGGAFPFWEGDGEDNGGDPGADPDGHIHGRQFTTSAPGTHMEKTEAFGLDRQAATPAVRGNNNLQTITCTNAPSAHRCYRVRQLNILP